MSLPVTVYRWDDAGAPGIPNGTPSEIINVLKKCLVEGYGAKQPLGWSVAFEDAPTNQIIFKNDISQGGSGGVVKFFDATGNDPVSGLVSYQSAQACSGINDLFNVGAQRVTRAVKNNHDAWVLIGTARGFYFTICKSASKMDAGTEINPTLFAGDIDSIIDSDAAVFVAGDEKPDDATSVNYSRTGFEAAGYSLNTSGFVMYDCDGHITNTQYYFNSAFLNGYSAINAPAGDVVPSMLSKVILSTSSSGPGADLGVDRFGVSRVESQVQPSLRGFIPGLFTSSNRAFLDEAWPVIREYDGKNYWLIRGTRRTGCWIWINVDQWYA
ncbi:hypothetical protein Q4519_14725 [Motilimonas sp. 1_MG-2023]|uniref:hypothetical protein n=1 Tax=Motilimonas sp. 1_MG-2023 TaxID=3062672 RepID=UPI0026E27DD3|nr:hypothetical protein [Motilimonas sp. 1_MG-2023]MDO6526938.1 hypothetical protein [Motilimonas sp. 1_MG-2023]